MGFFYFIIGVIVGTLLLVLLPAFIAVLGVALAVGFVIALPLIAVARSDLGKFFPAQTQPVIPGLFHAITRGEIVLVELVDF
jgi:hypothetical protein